MDNLLNVQDPLCASRVCLSGRHGYFATPHRFPPIRHFERIAGEEDFDALNVVEALTDDSIRDEIGQIEVAPAHERLYGAHAKPVMAAFAHWDADGGPFSDGGHGVFRFGLDRDTATAQALDAIADFLAATEESPTRVQMILYAIKLTGAVANLRAMESVRPGNSTAEMAKHFRVAGVAGVLLSSPRHDGGECVAAFNATVVADCRHAANIEFNWNGERVDDVMHMDPDHGYNRNLPEHFL